MTNTNVNHVLSAKQMAEVLWAMRKSMTSQEFDRSTIDLDSLGVSIEIHSADDESVIEHEFGICYEFWQTDEYLNKSGKQCLLWAIEESMEEYRGPLNKDRRTFLDFIYANAGKYMSTQNDTERDDEIGDFCKDTAYLIHSKQFGDGVTDETVKSLGTDLDKWKPFMKKRRACAESVKSMIDAIDEFESNNRG
jgi:hypothetical protein